MKLNYSLRTLAPGMVCGCERDSSKITFPCLANVFTFGNAGIAIHISCEKRLCFNERIARIEDTDIKSIGPPA